ncbi:MAG: leucine-rich repeat protein [Eubacterium sp.]
MGWAQNAKEINLSGVTLTTGENITMVPDGEFKNCSGLVKIVLPKTVTAIGDNAFDGCSELTTLGIGTVQENVVELSKITTIGANAFGSCSKIKNLDFGDYNARSTELVLKGKAFLGCSSLEKIEIPIKNALKMGASAFENCSGLKEIGLQKELQYIGNSVFKGAGSGTSGAKFYVIEEGVKELSTLPESIAYIDDYAFQSCYLKKMDLSACTNLKKINKSAFTGATFRIGDEFKIEEANEEELENIYKQYTIVLPNTLESIGEEAFHDCGIAYIDIPESCTDVGERVFSESRLFGAKLPKTLKTIKAGTFFRCYYLQGADIEIPADSQLNTIENTAFSECWRLTTTSFLAKLTNLKSIGEEAFSACYAYAILDKSFITNSWGEREVSSGLKEVVLPDCVTELGKGAFSNNYYMQTVTLGNGITNIPEMCFGNDSTYKNSGARLEKVIVSDKLETIGDKAFANQYKLTTLGTKSNHEEGTVQFSNGLVSIGNSAFLNCGKAYDNSAMDAVRILLSSDKIKSSYSKGCYELIVTKNGQHKSEHIFVDPSDIMDPVEETGSTEDCEEYYVVAQKKYYNPKDVVDSTVTSGTITHNIYETLYETTQTAYENRFVGTGSAHTKLQLLNTSVIFLLPTTGYVGVYMPPKAKDLGVTEKDNKKTVTLNYVFGMKKLTIPDSLKDDNIGEAAFMNCCNLEDVRLPKALTEIKKNTFNGCGAEIMNIVDRSDNEKFDDYYGLHSINIPDTVVNIDEAAFKNCMNLVLENPQGVGSSFGTGIQTIGVSAFEGCLSLNEVVFPSSLVSIGAKAFSKCTLMEKEEQELRYANSEKMVKYKLNKSQFGTSVIKKGLRSVDFVRASKLESIGNNAFEQTNIKQFDLSRTKVTAIETGLLKQCTYLETVTFSDLTESMANTVITDDILLSQLTAPISSTMQGDTVSGVYGKIGGWVSTDPALVLTQPEGDVQPLPINRPYELNINAVNDMTLYIGSTPTISIIDNGKENPIYSVKDGEVICSEYRGLSADVSKDSKGKYHFVITGTEYIDKDSPVTLRVKFATGLQILDSSSYWQSSQQIEYKVSVVEVVTEKVTVTAEEDGAVKNNPYMFVEKNGEKVLYLPSTGSTTTNGVTLTANIEPAETTQGYAWESSDTSLVDFVENTDQFEDGKATIKIKKVDPTKNGTAIITVKSGAKSDRITVVCQTSATGFDTVKTTGDNLPENLATSAQNPYILPNGNGGKDQLNITLRYPDGTDSTAKEQLIFISSNPDVINVDEMGNLTTKKASDEVVSITVVGQASGINKIFYFLVTDDQNVKASAVEITGKNEVNVDETIQLEAKVKPLNAGNKEVEWQVKSGSQNISVDSQGKVKGLKKGTATVIAISKENSNVKSSEFKITVHSPAKSIQILDKEIIIEQEKTYTISKTSNTSDKSGYVIEPADTDDSIEWKSSNEDVVSVSVSGSNVILKGIAPGKATVKATATSGVSKSISVTIEPKKIAVSSISIEKDVTLNVDETHALKPIILPSDANEEVTFTYSSNNEKIATVDANGVIHAVGAGTAIITAKTNTNRSSSCTVTVKQPAKSIQILDAPITLEVGKTYEINKATNASSSNGYVMTPANTNDKVEWTTSDSNVASITVSGTRMTVKAVSAGTATLKVTTTSGVSATITVTVVPKKVSVSGISITKEVTLNVGQAHTLTPTILPENANETVTFTYSSNNDKVATVDANGVIRAVGPGSATITAKTNTFRSASCIVTVKQPAKKITIYLNKPNVKKIYMAKGQSISIKAEKNPTTSTDTLSYKSNKKKVADVSGSGLIIAKNKGTAKITVQASSGAKATITVIVSKKEVKAKKIKVKAPSSMKRKQIKKLTVTLSKGNSTDTLSFYSSNSGIASVDAYGYVKAIKKGKVKITIQASSGKKTVKKIKIK